MNNREKLMETLNEVTVLEKEFDGLCPVSVLQRNLDRDCRMEMDILIKKGIIYHPDKAKNYLKRV